VGNSLFFDWKSTYEPLGMGTEGLGWGIPAVQFHFRVIFSTAFIEVVIGLVLVMMRSRTVLMYFFTGSAALGLLVGILPGPSSADPIPRCNYTVCPGDDPGIYSAPVPLLPGGTFEGMVPSVALSLVAGISRARRKG
jgi:hypothetical protein